MLSNRLRRSSPLNRPGIRLFLLITCLLAPFALVHADPAPVDPELDARLDEYINTFSGEATDNEQTLADIVADLDSDTPIATRVRARGYQLLAEFSEDNTEATLDAVDELIAQARSSDYAGPLAEAIAYKMELLWYLDRASDALLLAPDLEEHLESTESPRIRYYGHNLLARMLRDHSEYEDALNQFLAAYDAVQETDDSRTQLRRQFLNMQIAEIQAELNNYEQGLEITNRAINDAQEYGLEFNLPDIYLLKGYIAAQMEDTDASVQAHEDAIEWARQLERPNVVITSLNNIGSTYIDEERYEEARATLQQALTEIRGQESEDASDGINESLVRFNLAYLDIMQGDHDQAVERLEQHHDFLAERYSDADLAELLGYKAEAYREAGQLEKTIDTLIEQRELNASVFRSKRDERISELQTRYETREQATEIDLLENRNELQERIIENNRLQQRIVILFIIVILMGLALLWIAYSRLQEANRKLAYQSVHDALTGLLNRHAFQGTMHKRDQHGGERRDAHPDVIVLLDVDFFKHINDRYGHAGGDVVLRELAQRLKQQVRESDRVIRWGGEELLIYLRSMDPERLPGYVEDLLKRISETPIRYKDHEINVTVTGGYIQLPFDGLDEQTINWERALHIADMALYIGKTHGRNRAIGVDRLKVPYEEVKDTLSSDLAGAVERDQVAITTILGPEQGERRGDSSGS